MSGTRGPISKPTEEKQLRRTRSAEIVKATPATPVTMTARHIPETPKGLKKKARELREEVWSSPVATVWDSQMDVTAVIRYISSFDEWLTVQKDLKSQGYSAVGSQGQDVLSPVVAYARQLESQMSKLEGQLGLTPVARARLGLTLEEAKLTAAHVNKLTPTRRRRAERDEDE